MRWLLLLLILASDPPPTPNEEIGAKAMFRDPSLGVVHFSPRRDQAAPPRQRPPTKAAIQQANEPVGKREPPPLPEPPSKPAHGPASGGEPARSIGIRFWVQRVNAQGDVLGEMTAGQVFHGGDRIQLVVESNTEGYLAVVQQGSDGSSGLLFPPREIELGAERIPPHAKVVLPDPRHSFIFDQVAGTERLLIILARERHELAALPLKREMGPVDVAAVRQLAAIELGAKNLIIETFESKDEPATYTVNRAGSAIVQEIALVHEK